MNEPTTNRSQMDKLVRLSDVVDEIESLLDVYNGVERNFVLRRALKCVKRIPAVDAVEERHGEWIPFRGETGVEEFCYKEFTTLGFGCSVCHADIDVSEKYFRYCPMCGARMDGEEAHNAAD